MGDGMVPRPLPPDAAVYVISVAAELTGLHPQTLRTYERLGLITPGRAPGGGRRYSHRDIERLRSIAELTSAGIGIEGVRRLLDLEHRLDALPRATRSSRPSSRRPARRCAARSPYAATRRTGAAAGCRSRGSPPRGSRSSSGAAATDVHGSVATARRPSGPTCQPGGSGVGRGHADRRHRGTHHRGG